jgi:hypothetical protein
MIQLSAYRIISWDIVVLTTYCTNTWYSSVWIKVIPLCHLGWCYLLLSGTVQNVRSVFSLCRIGELTDTFMVEIVKRILMRTSLDILVLY